MTWARLAFRLQPSSIAGSRYFEILAREAAVLVGATVLVAGVAAVVVQRRRPE